MYKMEKNTKNIIGDFFMKKVLLIIIVLIFFFFFTKEDEEIRFRVIANSDSSFDQKLKLEIAKSLKSLLQETKDLNIIKEKCEYIVSRYNVNYEINVAYKKHRFEAKYVNDEILPGGVYKTLVIEIGAAVGKNYWTILYPQYFNVSFEDTTSQDIEYTSWFKEKIIG